jgi:glycosyltransferase involved in cell wall biosynthesis
MSDFSLFDVRKKKYEIYRSLHRVEEEIREITNGKKRILCLTPHLSTGGMPQYLLKKIESFNDIAEVYCIQYRNDAEVYNVQRNKIRDLLGERFFCLDDDDQDLINLIEEICPDVIHVEDFVEFFLPENVIQKIYDPARPYFIVETCHGSHYTIHNKTWIPDKFVMVNQFMVDRFKGNGIPVDLLEYPIEKKDRPDRNQSLLDLGLDPEKKHVINVGLFTPGKNQVELVEYARNLERYPIQFHFIGNTAPNFQEYWEPLLENCPQNCKIWGERHDVDSFYRCADLFVFTSKLELNPIVIKESLSWNLPILMRRLDTYLDGYDKESLVHYLVENPKDNINSIKKLLNVVL